MKQSPNLGLHLTSEEDSALNVAQWVRAQTGEEGDSNMMILDGEIAKRPRLHVSPAPPDAGPGDLWYQVLDE